MSTIDKTEQNIIHTYNRFPVTFEKGEGVFLYDENGKEYLDFAAGIGVCSLGYGNEKLNSVIKEQTDKLLHTSNLFYNKPASDAAEKLVKVVDVVHPDKELVEKYEERYQYFRKLYPTVKVLW